MNELLARIRELEARCSSLHSRLSWMRQSRNYWRERARRAEARAPWLAARGIPDATEREARQKAAA